MIEEEYKLTEECLISLMQGRKIILFVPDQYRIEIIPPNYGITVKYSDWEKIATFLRCAAYPNTNIIDELINKIENRK